MSEAVTRVYNHSLFFLEQQVVEAWFNVFVDGWIGQPFSSREEAVRAQKALAKMGSVQMAYRIHVKPKSID